MLVGHRLVEALAARLGGLDMAQLGDEVAEGVDQRMLTAREGALVPEVREQVAHRGQRRAEPLDHLHAEHPYMAGVVRRTALSRGGSDEVTARSPAQCLRTERPGRS